MRVFGVEFYFLSRPAQAAPCQVKGPCRGSTALFYFPRAIGWRDRQHPIYRFRKAIRRNGIQVIKATQSDVSARFPVSPRAGCQGLMILTFRKSSPAVET